MNEKPVDFGLYVCLNNESNEVCICAWCNHSKAFLNLTDISKKTFNATHWWRKPEIQIESY